MSKLVATLSIICVFGSTALGGSIKGKIESSKSLKSSQAATVVWVEGLPAGEPNEATPTMSQSGIQFLPRVMTVVAGQTVDFPNEDDVAHNVFSLSKANKFKLGIYPKGQSRQVTFAKEGVIDLFCSIHRHMHAVIVVTPSEHAALTEVGKPFEIANIPPGTYTVKIWNSAHKLVTKEVTVGDGPTELDVTLAD